jgi:hypothetical protein
MRAIVDYSSGVRFIMGDAAGPAARTKNPQGKEPLRVNSKAGFNLSRRKHIGMEVRAQATSQNFTFSSFVSGQRIAVRLLLVENAPPF